MFLPTLPPVRPIPPHPGRSDASPPAPPGRCVRFALVPSPLSTVAQMTNEQPATEPFDCPRCGGQSVERFYGPCAHCRAELGATMSGAARNVERSDFEPRAHVVANHVATKD